MNFMYDFLVWLQGFSNPFLTGFFSLVSDLIAPLPLSVIAIIIYWCISKKRGIGFALSVISAVTVNTALKLIFRVPRPFLVNDKIVKMDDTEGFSFPSGHSQQAGTLGRFVFGAVKKKSLGIFLWALVILTVGFSRMYLGMHTPLDVFVGAALGILITEAVLIYVSYTEKIKKPYMLHLITLVSALAMVFSGFEKDLVTMTALSFGAVTGYIIDEKYIGYSVPEGLKDKIKAGLTGLITVGLVKGIFELIPDGGIVLRFVDYGLFGFAITAAAPYMIKKLITERGE